MEVKGQVMAALLAGQAISEVAGQYNLPDSTVRQWSKDLGEEYAKVRAKKEGEFDELVGGYLKEVLVTLSIQARIFRDESWLKRQDASEAAVLHGVLTDKAIRLLEAAAAANSTEHEPVDPTTGASD